MIGFGRSLDSAFDAIRERLFSLVAGKSPGNGLVVALASRTPREGVTAAAIGLAASVARTGTLRVLLINYDVGPRGASARLRSERVVATEPALMGESIRSAGKHAIDVLTLSPSLPSGFAGDDAWTAAFEALSCTYHLVLVDAGSMQAPLAARWSRLARLLVLVVDTTRTTQEELARLRAELEADGRAVGAMILAKRRYRVPSFLYRYVS